MTVENPEYAQFINRAIRAMGRRAGADPDALPLLFQALQLADEQMGLAVWQLREEGYSWADVGKRLGVSRQAVQQRYGRNSHVKPLAVNDPLTLFDIPED